jgi:hypothetical protein
MIGRPLVDLHWYEVFAMVRMGCCILRTQELLRSIGQGDHFLTQGTDSAGLDHPACRVQTRSLAVLGD